MFHNVNQNRFVSLESLKSMFNNNANTYVSGDGNDVYYLNSSDNSSTKLFSFDDLGKDEAFFPKFSKNETEDSSIVQNNNADKVGKSRRKRGGRIRNFFHRIFNKKHNKPAESAESKKTIDISPKADASDKFDVVYSEMCKNVPDSTGTIEEKSLALAYCNKLITCSDITPDLRSYWENKDAIIQQEIIGLKNMEKAGQNESVNDVWQEFSDYVDKFKRPAGLDLNDVDAGNEYYMAYHSTCITYCQRLLNANDLTPELRNEYTKMIKEHQNDIERIQKEMKNSKTDKTSGISSKAAASDNFDEVFGEMRKNVPDSTGTIEEKRLAVAYIEKMLTCSDITPELKSYWLNKQTEIQREINELIKMNKAC